MQKCSPVEARKNLESARALSAIGVDFVCIPVSSMAGKNELISQGNEALESILSEAESAES
jgi:hypothetical protein